MHMYTMVYIMAWNLISHNLKFLRLKIFIDFVGQNKAMNSNDGCRAWLEKRLKKFTCENLIKKSYTVPNR